MSHCAIVGCGGLGAPAAALLAQVAAEGTRLTLIDDDRVDLSNLPRQPLYGTADVARPKVEAAASRLAEIRPDLEIRTFPERLEGKSAGRLLADAQVILDGTDSLETKLLLNQLAIERRTPLVHAGVLGLDGQLSTILPGETACLRCLFADIPREEELATCQQAGVLGPVVGAVGLAAAREASFLLRGQHPPCAGRFSILDGATLRWRALEMRRRPECPVCADLAVLPAHRETPSNSRR